MASFHLLFVLAKPPHFHIFSSPLHLPVSSSFIFSRRNADFSIFLGFLLPSGRASGFCCRGEVQSESGNGGCFRIVSGVGFVIVLQSNRVNWICNSVGVRPTIKPFVNGGASGMLATCVIQPIDMIKVRIQLGQGSAGMVTRNMLKIEGFGAFYKALWCCSLKLLLGLNVLVFRWQKN